MGPTGVGKSDLADLIAESTPSEIVNIDVGQLYEPLSIGTAKPDWKNATVPHHFFDILTEPNNLSVREYRERLSALIQDIKQRGKRPILVGGSGFYINSLFFPPLAESTEMDFDTSDKEAQELWEELNQVDPDRALHIHPHDMYRVQRALAIWKEHGVKPSDFKPQFDPIADAHIVIVNRSREELYDRINQRTHIMLDEGWIDEVKALLGTEWEEFLNKKKLIGYDDIISYLKGPQDEEHKHRLINTIQKKTRHYAKRQRIYNNMLKKKIAEQSDDRVSLEEIDLSLASPTLYVDRLKFES